MQKITSKDLANPQDVKLDGLERNVQMISPMGPVHIRWSRNVETVFGRTPERAVLSAMTAIKKALYSSSFPMEILSSIKEWEMVFVDEQLPVNQIPAYLRQTCHPAWMVPPNNLYFVSQRIVAGCSGQAPINKNLADKELTKILLHEMGHAIEFHLLKQRQNQNRKLAEGFATWFTSITAPYAGFFSNREIAEQNKKLAEMRLNTYGTSSQFYGDEMDYAYSATPYFFIANKMHISEVWQLYKSVEDSSGLAGMIQSRYKYSDPGTVKEIERIYN